jgi:glutamate dehydrogenase
MGKDIQSVPFTVVGIGDMSGDVFGNGMLLSRQIRLVGAFDHRHIFVDPDPDPETSYRERERLFKLGRSSWEDYDQALLSRGGMIIPRGSKSVELSPEAREALGIEMDEASEEPADPLDGESLIRAILGAPVELLWNGGIGTYIKSSTETHADAGDATNDAVRIDASELRAKVIGEGGNLGMTQRARIEHALNGGRLNTDAIDNSGGVDLSDREVNLKILLNEAVLAKRMTMEERNALLRDLAQPIARLVLADNEAQSLAVSLDEIRAGEGVDDLRDLMSGLEKAGFLNRADEHLPTWEALVERLEEGKTLTRPELCVLLAYAKLYLMSHILRGALPDDAASVNYLLNYFPEEAIADAGEESLASHRLRREIIASQLTNDLTNLMGAGFIQRVGRDTGKAPHEVARAWLIAARLAGHQEILEELKTRGKALPLPVVYRWLLGLSRVLERTTRWVLANIDDDRSTSEVIAENAVGLAKLRERFGEIVIGEDRVLYESLVGEIEKLGAAEGFARSLVTLRFLDQLLEILKVVRETKAEPVDAARSFYRVSALLEVPWLRQNIFDVARDDRWEQRLAQALAEDLTRSHQRVAAGVMAVRADAPTIDDAVDQVVEARTHDVARFHDLLEEVRTGSDGITLAGLSVVVREVSRIARQVERNGK